MAGHWLSRLVCFLVGHTLEQNWRTGRWGVSWECKRCHTLTPSPVLRRVK